MDCYHIEHPDQEHTLCGLGWQDWGQNVDAVIITLQDAASEVDLIPEEEKCDICWRNDEWTLHLLAEVP